MKHLTPTLPPPNALLLQSIDNMVSSPAMCRRAELSLQPAAGYTVTPGGRWWVESARDTPLTATSRVRASPVSSVNVRQSPSSSSTPGCTPGVCVHGCVVPDLDPAPLLRLARVTPGVRLRPVVTQPFGRRCHADPRHGAAPARADDAPRVDARVGGEAHASEDRRVIVVALSGCGVPPSRPLEGSLGGRGARGREGKRVNPRAPPERFQESPESRRDRPRPLHGALRLLGSCDRDDIVLREGHLLVLDRCAEGVERHDETLLGGGRRERGKEQAGASRCLVSRLVVRLGSSVLLALHTSTVGRAAFFLSSLGQAWQRLSEGARSPTPQRSFGTLIPECNSRRTLLSARSPSTLSSISVSIWRKVRGSLTADHSSSPVRLPLPLWRASECRTNAGE